MTKAVGATSVLVILSVFLTGCQGSSANQTDPRVVQGLAIAPVPLNFSGKDRNLVGVGSYLVNAVADCNGCHTYPSYAEGGNPFLGQPEKINTVNYLAGGMAFGPFCSRNITPDEAGKPAGMDLQTFINVMRTGADMAHPGQLLQVMPWPTFKNMTDDDLRAIYEYLSAIPSAQPSANAQCMPEM